MNTPLQHAAWAVIARWESPAWKDMPHTGMYIAELRKALADEQAQKVEPVARVKKLVNCAIIDSTGCAECWEDLPDGTPLFTHPAPPAGERDHCERALNMVGERAEYKSLNRRADVTEALRSHAPTFADCDRAAAMLEADAREIKRLEQCRIDEAETTNKAAQESRDLLTKALNEAQQVAVPMTIKELEKALNCVGSNGLILKVKLAVEKHHGIGAKP